tara:strand:+ start:892 stop:1089 length:198 start_codon:yes stop_codon:yes gene_type:complete
MDGDYENSKRIVRRIDIISLSVAGAVPVIGVACRVRKHSKLSRVFVHGLSGPTRLLEDGLEQRSA